MSSFSQKDLAVVRRAFARQIMAATGIENEHLEQAFAHVRREDFIGAPPWYIARYNDYLTVRSPDPVVLYQDCLFSLQPERKVNNGSPSLHAWGLHVLGLQKGYKVAHVGCGSGYYTAVIAHIVGETGSVKAVEFDLNLATRAKDNLREQMHVNVSNDNGSSWPHEPADAIYVNYAVSRPSKFWIENLVVGGRLIFPLGVPEKNSDRRGPRTASGIFLLISREANGYRATSLGPAYFVLDESDRVDDDDETIQLRECLARNDPANIKSLRIGSDRQPDEWFSGKEWGLSCEAYP